MAAFVSEQRAHCPFCGEPISLLIDISGGSNAYIEDCEVCCRPMHVHVEVDGDRLTGLRVESAA